MRRQKWFVAGLLFKTSRTPPKSQAKPGSSIVGMLRGPQPCSTRTPVEPGTPGKVPTAGTQTENPKGRGTVQEIPGTPQQRGGGTRGAPSTLLRCAGPHQPPLPCLLFLHWGTGLMRNPRAGEFQGKGEKQHLALPPPAGQGRTPWVLGSWRHVATKKPPEMCEPFGDGEPRGPHRFGDPRGVGTPALLSPWEHPRIFLCRVPLKWWCLHLAGWLPAGEAGGGDSRRPSPGKSRLGHPGQAGGGHGRAVWGWGRASGTNPGGAWCSPLALGQRMAPLCFHSPHLGPKCRA